MTLGIGSRNGLRRVGGLAARLALLSGAALSAGAAYGQAGPPPPAGAAGGPPTDQFKLLKALPLSPPGSRPPSSDPRDFNGIYTTEALLFLPRNLPLTPKALAEEERDRQRMAAGKPTGGLPAICRPQPTFSLGSDLFPGQIVQTPTQVVLLNEEHRTRLVVYLDRDHPKDLKPSYFGDSVGRWDGDTLVIDTIGFNGRERTVSPQAHVVTRVRKIEGGRRLEIQSTITDPINYTQPVTDTYFPQWNPEVQMLEFQCEENLEGAKEGLDLSQ